MSCGTSEADAERLFSLERNIAGLHGTRFSLPGMVARLRLALAQQEAAAFSGLDLTNPDVVVLPDLDADAALGPEANIDIPLDPENVQGNLDPKSALILHYIQRSLHFHVVRSHALSKYVQQGTA
jgi:hypothetical protein